MTKINFRSGLPYAIALIIFIIIAYVYASPVLEGKIINQSDISSYQGAAKERDDYKKQTGEESFWTNSMFSGMPTTMIGAHYKGNYLENIYNYLFWGPRPASYLILTFISFFLLLLAMGVNVRISIVGALAFGLCAYNFQILQVGHNSKMVAIAFMPMVLAGVVYAYRKKALLGAVLFGFALSFEIAANHPQITFYLGMIILAYAVAQFVSAIKNKTLPAFVKTSCFILIATLLGAGTNVNRLWPNWEYSKYTMRGGSELQMAHAQGNQTQGGLNKEYATAWSYGIEETPNLLIPNFNGGASASELSKKSRTYEILKQGGAPNAEQIIKQMPTYWGPQAFTAGPMYMGAISVFLFVLGLVVLQGSTKWWIAGISLLALLLGWGKHFMWLSSLFFDYVPLYNKFRVPSMILTILQLTIPLLGFYSLNQIFSGNIEKKRVIKGFKTALGITGGFCLLFALLPSLAGSFTSPADGQFPEWLQQALPEDRQSMLRSDAFRSLLFILAGAATLWAGYVKKIKLPVSLTILGLLIVLDMWNVDKRYLNNDHFVTPREFTNNFNLRPVDKEILKDTDIHYRVLDLAVNTFNDSHSSFHHKTIGGYSAAKLQRYQDIIDYHLIPEIQSLANDLQKGQTPADIDSSFQKLSVINMLNTKYIILSANSAPIENTARSGNAWFVENYRLVGSPDEEILSLKSINPEKTAIIGRDFAQAVDGKNIRFDTTATIQLISYAPNKLVYKTKANEEQLAVFSEVYYPEGWKAYIDNQAGELFRTDYILRGLLVPAGEHTITLEYNPQSAYQGALISQISSFLLILALLGIIIGHIRENRKCQNVIN